jgi:hypothetical protein
VFIGHFHDKSAKSSPYCLTPDCRNCEGDRSDSS